MYAANTSKPKRIPDFLTIDPMQKDSFCKNSPDLLDVMCFLKQILHKYRISFQNQQEKP